MDSRSAETLRRLELDVTRRLDGLLQGDHLGLVGGHGSEPGDTRKYQPGDDVRRIDWNVSARTDETYIRETIADRELDTWLVVDRSASLDFGTALMQKSELAMRGCAGIGFLTSRGGNRVGAVVDGPTQRIVPARGGRRHLMSILDQIATTECDQREQRLGQLISGARSVARRRGLVAVVSDFLDPPDSWRHQLAAVAGHHQVLAIEVVDPRELELPNVGVIVLDDNRTGAQVEVDTGKAKVRDAYAEAAATQRATIDQAIASSGADHVRLRTDTDWVLELARHVSRRSNHQRRSTR